MGMYMWPVEINEGIFDIMLNSDLYLYAHTETKDRSLLELNV